MSIHPLSKESIENIFSYHRPTGDQPERYEEIRREGKKLALCILACTPAGGDQAAAIRKVREAVMTANAAIAIGESEAKKEEPEGE